MTRKIALAALLALLGCAALLPAVRTADELGLELCKAWMAEHRPTEDAAAACAVASFAQPFVEGARRMQRAPAPRMAAAAASNPCQETPP